MDFVAEIGLNYNGNLNLALEMIRQAKLSGATVVKFQLGWRSEKGDLNHLTIEDINTLQEFSIQQNIELMFSIITEDALNLIKNFNFSRLKIASRTVIDAPELCEEIINLNKVTYISLGMWNEKSFPFPKTQNISYIWCNSKYPTLKSDMQNFPQSFSSDSYYGYSDHALGISYCLVAISRGARYIEKHFTLDKSNSSIRDHVLSATPNEFENLVKLGTEIFSNFKN
jgi:N,N'-diacetyllegionaminate synthase